MEQPSLPPFLPVGHKYALVALPIHVGDSVPNWADLSNEYHVTRGLGFGLPDHWREWIGSIAVSQLEEEEHSCLWATSRAHEPGLLDELNERLKLRVQAWFRGLLLAAPAFGTSGHLTMLTGAHTNEGVDVRERANLDRPIANNGVAAPTIEVGHLRDAVTIGEQILSIHDSGKYRRLRYVVEGFYRGAKTVDVAERIHEFVRCVEGCILPPRGDTRAKFLNRTELFLGPRNHEWAGMVYDIRSAVEHLNDQLPVLTKPTEREAILTVFRHAYEVQELARHCLHRIFTRTGLLDHFLDDGDLNRFWGLTMAERATLWGEPMDLSKVSGLFNPDYVQITGW